MTDHLTTQVMDVAGVEHQLEPYHYQSAIHAVDPGAVNLSGLAHSLCDWIGLIEADLSEWDREVEGAIFDIRWACQQAWNKGGSNTGGVNRDRDVVEHVERLTMFAFDSGPMRRVACHPIIRLVVGQMAELAGVIVEDPLYITRWSDAYEKAMEIVGNGG